MLAVAQVTSLISETRVESCFLIKIKDLEVRCLSRVVSLDKALWSTLSLVTQVYKWVPAAIFIFTPTSRWLPLTVVDW